MNKPIPLRVAGPTPDSVQADMLARLEQTHTVTNEVAAMLRDKWDQAVVLARAEEIARAKRNDVWIAASGMAVGVALSFLAMHLTGSVISRNTQEAMTSGVVIGKAEANQEALNQAAPGGSDDQGYKRTEKGWTR